MDRDKILDRIQKLLALSKSDNEYEASLALEKAQELLLKHNLDMAEVRTAEERQSLEGMTHQPYRTSVSQGWKKRLAVLVSDMNFCKILYAGPNVLIIGRAENAEAVAEMLDWVIPQLDRIARRETIAHGGSMLKWRNSFLQGAVRQVWQRLYEARKRFEEQYQGTTALVVAHERENEWYIQNTWPRIVHRYSSAPRLLTDAYVRGRQSASEVSLHPPSRQVDSERGLIE